MNSGPGCRTVQKTASHVDKDHETFQGSFNFGKA